MSASHITLEFRCQKCDHRWESSTTPDHCPNCEKHDEACSIHEGGECDCVARIPENAVGFAWNYLNGTIYDAEKGRVIADVRTHTGGWSQREADAHGRLIAAAPELLAALRELIELAPSTLQSDLAKLPDAMDRAEAATAKAEGRQP